MEKINGGRPDITLYDELDILVMHYGKEAVLKMFHDAMPKVDGYKVPFITGMPMDIKNIGEWIDQV
jgi:hypothetical protein